MERLINNRMTDMRKFISLTESQIINEETFEPTSGSAIFDGRWAEFMAALRGLPSGVSEADACAKTGINEKQFMEIAEASIGGWRNSPKESLLHAISYLDHDEVPQEGRAIFKDAKWQTLFFRNAHEHGIAFNGLAFRYSKKSGEMVTDRSSNYSVKVINDIIRCLYLYWYLHRNAKVKLPKLIYRGIRAHDLYNHASLKDAVDAVYTKDVTHAMRRKMAMDVLFKWICDKKLHQITDGNILSFTATVPVAKYFANGEGFILSVDPSKVEIITSHAHDERLAGGDPMTGKQEKEWIVRIPHDYEFTRDDILIHDLDYFIADQNPLCVSLFDHDDKASEYDMNGVHVTARARWNNNGDKIQITFNNRNRKEFKEQNGFDPMPDPKNLAQITNFKMVKAASRW